MRRYGSARLLLVFATALFGCNRSESDWEDARAADTVAAYESYLREHPESPRAPEAEAALENAHFAAAKLSGTEAAFAGHLQRFPESRHAETCREHILDMRIEAARGDDSEQAYAAVLAQYPEGAFNDRSRERLAEMKRLVVERAFGTAAKTGTVESYRAFLTAHPDAPQRARAESSIRMLGAWASAESAGTLAGYREFVTAYPGSAFTSRAREAMREIAIRDAFARGSARPEHRNSKLTVEQFRRILGGAELSAGLSHRAQQHALDALIEHALLQGTPTFSVPGIQPLPIDSMLDPDAESGVMMTGSATSDRYGWELSKSGMIVRRDGRLNGSVGKGLGVWGELPKDLKRIGLVGCLAVRMQEGHIVFSTTLPRDQIYTEISMRGSGATLVPVAPGSIFRITGEVKGLFENHVLRAKKGSTLCFALLEKHGLTYLCGKGEIELPDGTKVALPPAK